MTGLAQVLCFSSRDSSLPRTTTIATQMKAADSSRPMLTPKMHTPISSHIAPPGSSVSGKSEREDQIIQWPKQTRISNMEKNMKVSLAKNVGQVLLNRHKIHLTPVRFEPSPTNAVAVTVPVLGL